MRSRGGRSASTLGTSACGLKAAALGLQVFPQRARPTMPRKTCGKKAIKEVQGLEPGGSTFTAAALGLQVAAVLGLQVFPQPRS